MPNFLKRPGAGYLGVLVLAALILAVPAGRRPFWSSDEARQALLGRSVLEHGRWLVAELRERPYLNKPQLYFWSIALASLPVGRVTEVTAVIPSLLSALAGIAGVIAVGRFLWGWPTGLLAGLMLTATLYHYEIGHQVLPDVMLNAWMVWALYCLLRARAAGATAGWPGAFYACIGAALLTKGPAGLAALAAGLVAMAFTDGPRALAKLRPLWGLGVLAVAVLVWLVPYHVLSHGAFTGQVVRDHSRFFHSAGLLERLANLASALPDFFPWTILLAGAVWWWRAAPDPTRRWLLLWTVTLWLLLGLSGIFRSRYLLPVYPGLALLTAEFVTRAASRAGRRPLQVASIACGLATLVAAVLILTPAIDLVSGDDRAYVPTVLWERALMAALAAAGGASLLLAVRREAFTTGAVALALAIGGIFLLEGVTYPGRYARAYDVRPLAAAAVAHVPPGGVIIGHPDLRLSYDFYLRRPVLEIASRQALAARMAAGSPDVVIMRRAHWNTLAPEAAAWRVLSSAVVGEREMVVVGQDPR